MFHRFVNMPMTYIFLFLLSGWTSFLQILTKHSYYKNITPDICLMSFWNISKMLQRPLVPWYFLWKCKVTRRQLDLDFLDYIGRLSTSGLHKRYAYHQVYNHSNKFNSKTDIFWKSFFRESLLFNIFKNIISGIQFYCKKDNKKFKHCL